MKKTILTATLAGLLAAAPVLAADKGYNGHFGDMDKNKDGAVTWEEFKGFFPHAEKTVFADADRDQNGKLDHDEWHAFKEKHGYGHGPKEK